ncbi:hypothetical protein LPB86_16195 [Pedobacter sp. MC2016-14]|uniref:hypothetical protein n=1 Tax=Pedobacter sp. MC2016-14 TaxID=2897327 RepID=UPI001E479A11|nr:hypothetical protein [Pedobacter sp. MC2016-14]MCD0489785.1 hypothetical protein [Pedobacter sp. MC2016-14]
MTTTEQYLHTRPCGIKSELKAYSENVLTEFFNDYDLEECHNFLWKLLKPSFTGTNSNLNNDDRCSLVSFYERFHELLIATAILYNEREINKCTLEKGKYNL